MVRDLDLLRLDSTDSQSSIGGCRGRFACIRRFAACNGHSVGVFSDSGSILAVVHFSIVKKGFMFQTESVSFFQFPGW